MPTPSTAPARCASRPSAAPSKRANRPTLSCWIGISTSWSPPANRSRSPIPTSPAPSFAGRRSLANRLKHNGECEDLVSGTLSTYSQTSASKSNMPTSGSAFLFRGVIARTDCEKNCARVNKRELTRVRLRSLTQIGGTLATSVASGLPQAAAGLIHQRNSLSQPGCNSVTILSYLSLVTGDACGIINFPNVRIRFAIRTYS